MTKPPRERRRLCQDIRIDRISPNTDLNFLGSLASILQKPGPTRVPLIVSSGLDGRYCILERNSLSMLGQIEVAKRAGESMVPAFVTTERTVNAFEYWLIDQLQQGTLYNGWDECRALQYLAAARNLSNRDLARLLNRKFAWVAKRLELLTVPADEKSEYVKKNFSDDLNFESYMESVMKPVYGPDIEDEAEIRTPRTNALLSEMRRHEAILFEDASLDAIQLSQRLATAIRQLEQLTGNAELMRKLNPPE